MASDSLASLKTTNGELQDSLSSLTVKYKDLEVNYNVLWESTKTHSKAIPNSNVSTSEGCSKCYKIDVQTCVANLVNLEELNKAKDCEIKRLNVMLQPSKAAPPNPSEGQTCVHIAPCLHFRPRFA